MTRAPLCTCFSALVLISHNSRNSPAHWRWRGNFTGSVCSVYIQEIRHGLWHKYMFTFTRLFWKIDWSLTHKSTFESMYRHFIYSGAYCKNFADQREHGRNTRPKLLRWYWINYAPSHRSPVGLYTHKQPSKIIPGYSPEHEEASVCLSYAAGWASA